MGANLLRNGNFEADWSEEGSHRCLVFETDGTVLDTERGNIFTPPGWITWFKHGLPVEHDPANTVGWAQPEVRDAWAKDDEEHGGYPGPDRSHGGRKGQLYFTFFRIHEGGFLQQVEVTPGTRIRLSAWAHAWSNMGTGPNKDDPNWSDGEGVGDRAFFALEGEVEDGAAKNFTFWVGIDPTGGTNPYSDTVVWGRGAHIYNAYHEVPAVEATAQSDTVTVFVRSRSLWPFKHNDAYWDDVVLEMVEGPAEWPYLVIPQGSKLGVHSILSDDVFSYIATLNQANTRFPVVKAVQDLGWLPGVRENAPDTITIARIAHDAEGCIEVNDPEADLDELADGLMGPILERLASNPELRNAVDYWEVANEPDPPDADGYRRLALLMIKCMERAEDAGLKIGIFGLNTGTPEWDEMEAMVGTGVFGRAREGGHILTLHEGVIWPDKPIDLWWGSDIPGCPEGLGAEIGAGSLCFRYRFLYHMLQQRGEVIPLVISEWYCHRYEEVGGTPEEVRDRARWYDTEFRKDYWAWGFCPFTLGPIGEWTRQDYGFAYPTLVQYMISVKEEANGLPSETGRTTIEFKPDKPQVDRQVRVIVTSTEPYTGVALHVTDPDGEAVSVVRKPISPPPQGSAWKWAFTPRKQGVYHALFTAEGGELQPVEGDLTVPPVEEEIWGLPRVQYVRTYLLLPPGTGREWIQAVVNSGVWERHRWTIGGSADDGGIGALVAKRVIAVNPGRWPSDLRAFYQEHYPQTVYVPLEADSPADLQNLLPAVPHDFTPRPEPPDEVWGLPREQYARTYVLLPPDAGQDWIQAVVDSGVWEERRWTIGGSADDAGIGSLGDKRVIAVNPDRWPSDLRAFYQEHYPRTQYISVEADNPSELRLRLGKIE